MAATTHVERLGGFVSNASFDQLSAAGAALRTGARCSTTALGITKADLFNLTVRDNAVVLAELIRDG